MRWDRAGLVDIVSIYGEDRGQFDPSRTFVRPRHYFFALPQREIDLSNGILKQDELLFHIVLGRGKIFLNKIQ